jgi:uncharacterized cupin superfamily protein
MPSRIGQLASSSLVTGLPPSVTNPIRPELYAGRHHAALARAVGLAQFGVNHVVLDPGAGSALRHWHEQEDEFVFVLSGEVTLVDDHGEHRLTAGDYVGFPAGEANAHHLINRSNAPAAFLAMGTRHVGRETIHYPDDPAIGVASVVRDQRGERITAA